MGLIVAAPLSGLPFADDLDFTSRIEGAQNAFAWNMICQSMWAVVQALSAGVGRRRESIDLTGFGGRLLKLSSRGGDSLPWLRS
jgi:hypothetical protein